MKFIFLFKEANICIIFLTKKTQILNFKNQFTAKVDGF